jgi:aspartate/methionine/tyrosine aminotransferase
VAAEAAAFAAGGNQVYPFHLGDLNRDAREHRRGVKAIRDGKTGYCPNAGIPALREALAADLSASHGLHYTAENVATCWR